MQIGMYNCINNIAITCTSHRNPKKKPETDNIGPTTNKRKKQLSIRHSKKLLSEVI